MAMNPRLLRPLALPRLLDFAPGAAAAFSLRQLSSSYAGPVVTVRRSSDDAEADFTAGEVNDGTLAAWVGGGNDGFVKTWHDQSGNNRDASQATSANQPKIVSSGSLVAEGGNPAVQFDGADDYLVAVGYKPSGVLSIFFVHRLSAYTTAQQTTVSCHKTTPPSGGFVVAAYAPSGTRDKILFQTGLGGTWVDGANVLNGGEYTISQQMFSVLIRSSTSAFIRNGAQLFSEAKGAVVAGNDLTIGSNAPTPGSYAAMTSQELVVYHSDQSTLRQRIEGDIAWYY